MSALPNPDKHFVTRRPEGEDRDRLVCHQCGWINYVNPKLIVGAVCTYQDQFLLCKRAIEPRVGFWTIPAGFMEENETTEQGAAREVREEACAEVTIDALLGIYSIPRLSQVHLIYRAELTEPVFAAGPESLDVMLVEWDQIPWEELSFPTVFWALKHYAAVKGQTAFPPFRVTPDQIDWKFPGKK
jgi:ADP-ribose pyrophosphatase YjhB (NUDIX family)